MIPAEPAPAFDHLGEALRWLRRKRGLKQRELAERCGVSKSMLSAFERGRHSPRLETLEKVLEGLGTDLETLARTLRQVRGERPLFTAWTASLEEVPAEASRFLGGFLGELAEQLKVFHGEQE